MPCATPNRRCRLHSNDAPSRAGSDGPSLLGARHQAGKHHRGSSRSPTAVGSWQHRRISPPGTKLSGRVVRPGNFDRCTHPTPPARRELAASERANGFFAILGIRRSEFSGGWYNNVRSPLIAALATVTLNAGAGVPARPLVIFLAPFSRKSCFGQANPLSRRFPNRLNQLVSHDNVVVV